jgi:AcrR family transcriptional regulator
MASTRGRPKLTDKPGTTKAQLLDTAELRFAQHGYQGTSVRLIADQAGVNLGAIHYYWRTKEALCREVLERRLLPVLEARNRCLDEALAAGASFADLLDASHRPSLMVAGATPRQAASFRKFYGRMLFDPAPEVRAMLASLMDTYAVRFVSLLRNACPTLSDEEFYWRVTFMYGAFLYAHTEYLRTSALWGKAFDRNDTSKAADYLNYFLNAAMQAAPMR